MSIFKKWNTIPGGLLRGLYLGFPIPEDSESDRLEEFTKPEYENKKPLPRDLQGYVTPRYAQYWRRIGVQLGLDDAKLDTIRADNPHSVEDCCNRMFAEWLNRNPTASWKDIFTAIERAVKWPASLLAGLSLHEELESVFNPFVSPFLLFYQHIDRLVRMMLIDSILESLAMIIDAMKEEDDEEEEDKNVEAPFNVKAAFAAKLRATKEAARSSHSKRQQKQPQKTAGMPMTDRNNNSDKWNQWTTTLSDCMEKMKYLNKIVRKPGWFW